MTFLYRDPFPPFIIEYKYDNSGVESNVFLNLYVLLA